MHTMNNYSQRLNYQFKQDVAHDYRVPMCSVRQIFDNHIISVYDLFTMNIHKQSSLRYNSTC